MLTFWTTRSHHRKPEDYLFPSEKVGLDGDAGYLKGAVTPCDINREKPMGSWTTAWNQARKTAAIILAGNPKNAEDIAPLACRFHDCRHTAVSRTPDAGVTLAKVAKIVGWSRQRWCAWLL